LALVVLICATGAAAGLLAASRGWAVEVIDRPAPLPDQVSRRTGGDLRPWLPALGWAGLAGAGALLATRAAARRLVGGLLGLAGAGIGAGAVAAVAAGVSAGGPVGAPAVAAAGGLLVLLAGGLAMVRGGRWPAMGPRYERRTAAGAGRTGRAAEPGEREVGDSASAGAAPDPAGAGTEPTAADTGRGIAGGAGVAAMWAALDRGEDPTAR
jgi:hypothetical protein